MMSATVKQPQRLADYFVVLGFDETKERNGVSIGRVVQRFPTQDWPDVPFFHGLEVFCQPQGWVLRAEHEKPQFFIGALTNVEGQRHYAACLSFCEPRFPSESPIFQDDDDDLEMPVASPSVVDSNQAPVLYRPKCLVLVSQHHFFETFRDCLTIIYTMHIDYASTNIEDKPSLENLVSTLVAGLKVPNFGGPLFKFSLGAGDRQAVQPPSSAMIPTTGCTVAILFKQLGTIHNVLCLFCAVLTDKRILFHSMSYRRLSDACYAMSSLIYPLKYSYVYVPLLPETALEVLESPTPFIMGVHSSLKNKTCEYDVISVDLDCGSVIVPDDVTIPSLPEPYYGRLLNNLTLVLNAGLHTADAAFQPSGILTSRQEEDIAYLDKLIRSCFIRLFADLFTRYRICLQLVRLHSKPYITFHKAAFLGLRGLQGDEFMMRLVEGMSFQSFITERAASYRVCDLFDEICANFQDTLKQENGIRERILKNIHNLAQQLVPNEAPAEHFVKNIPEPSTEALNNPVPPSFPKLDESVIGSLIKEMLAKQETLRKNSSFGRLASISSVPTDVPIGEEKISSVASLSGPDVRRLDVLRNCLHCIFENRVSDARKMLSAVLLSMKSQAVRVAFCQELHNNLYPQNRATLEPQQFDLIVRLMNCALQNESVCDEHGIAYALLTLSNTYCRRLTPGILQFAYTCIQDHDCWSNIQFWEAVFFHDIHRQMRQLYLPSDGKPTDYLSSNKTYPFGKGILCDTWNLCEEPTALQLASNLLKVMPRLDQTTMAQQNRIEESIVFSQAVHYTNLIVCMRTPLDASRLRKVNLPDLERQSVAGSHVTARFAGFARNTVVGASKQYMETLRGDDATSETSSADSDVESGFVEDPLMYGGPIDSTDVGQGTVRWIAKFLDKVCSEAGLPPDQLNKLHQRIPGFLAMHVENLEQVYRESKRLPPIHKPKLLVPVLLPGERILQGHLRVFLLPDGRYDSAKMVEKSLGCNLLPAEGALFLTNYRVIFKGQPCDLYICEQVVVRAFPIMSMTKDKRIGQQLVATGTEQSAHNLHDALQIRSATCQLFKIAFDEEVTTEKVEAFCASLEHIRWPETIYELFALSSIYGAPGVGGDVPQEKMKQATLSAFAKRTILKTARKAGLGIGKQNTKQKDKYVLSNGRSSTYGDYRRDSDDEKLPKSDEMSAIDYKMTLTRTLEKLDTRDYARDYERLCLCTRAQLTVNMSGHTTRSTPGFSRNEYGFRLTTVNRFYEVCRSYPAAFVVPAKIPDDSLRKIAKGHKHGRFPVVTWCSSGGAMLLHGSSFHTKNMVSRLKKQAGLATYGNPSDKVSRVSPRKDSASSSSPGLSLPLLRSSAEQERYLAALVCSSPANAPIGDNHLTSSMGSLLSMDSLMLTSLDTSSTGSASPEAQRKALAGQLKRTADFVRSSGAGRGMKTMVMSGRFGSLRPSAHQRNPSTSSMSSTLSVSSQNKRHSSYLTPSYASRRDIAQPQTLHRSSLYIFGERTQAKAFKLPHKCEFIPILYPTAHDVKPALKKFLRIVSPSAPPSPDMAYSHLRLLEDCGWMRQVKSLLQIASAIVDLIDIQNSSVAICLEDGWDATIQLSSLAQILLDPYYRTLDGFRVLIEKEWLGFGHRFSHRGNHTIASANSGVAPIFMLFLDVVHQIHRQYPSAFEFNDFYLRFLAYHSLSGYYRTFLLDSEIDRVEAGLIFDGKSKPRPEINILASQEDLLLPENNDNKKSPYGNSAQQQLLTPPASIWETIENRNRRSPLFYNFLYCPDAHGVLRTHFELPSLDVWDFYFEDSLSHGCTYDLDAAEVEIHERQADRANVKDLIGIGRTSRRVVDVNYDNVIAFAQPTAFQAILEEIEQLEKDLDMLPQKWSDVLQKANHQNVDSDATAIEGDVSIDQEWSRWLDRALHKKYTLDLLLKGRMATQQQQQQNKSRTNDSDDVAHQFQSHNFAAPEYCQVCNRILWGVVVKHGLRCFVCGYSCHEKCVSVAAQNCIAPVPEPTEPVSPPLEPKTEDPVFDDPVTPTPATAEVVHRRQDTVRTYEGYLLKRGVRLRGWKPRYFVLDSTMHQLRYYDNPNDTHCKGIIDLGEVQSISLVAPPSIMPKRMEGAYFDLRTARRIYNFMAQTLKEAEEWMERIQACLQ